MTSPTVRAAFFGFEVADNVLGELLAQLDAPEEPEPGQGCRPVEHRRHRLDLLVIGGHAAADQAEGRREPVEHVDLDREARLPQQLIGRIEPRGSGPDDDDSEGLAGRARPAHPERLLPVTPPRRG